MNLIHDAWIPVRRKNGEKLKIAPCQVTDGIGTDKEIAELVAPRPDFNGALIQFLIGLLQTTSAPQNIGEWRKWLNNPPSSDELKNHFDSIAYAFNLDGDGPRFMQDIIIQNDDSKKTESIDQLLIEAPGWQPINFNTDHFVKRETIKHLCYSCVANALVTLQLNASEGGRGHFTGLRGGGPLTTLVYSDNLYKMCWNNVLEEAEFLKLGNSKKSDNKDRFPWLTGDRMSNNGIKTTPNDVHPAQLFFAMPRRVLLQFEEIDADITCDLCGEVCYRVSKQYNTRPNGIDYKGVWKHPLSPLYMKDNNPLHVHQHDNIGYRHWLGYIQSNTDEKRFPAMVIEAALNRLESNFRIMAFGYDLKKDKARCWYEGLMPVIIVEDQYRKSYTYYVAGMIKASDKIANDLAWQIKEALYNLKIKANKNKNFGFVKTCFWEETEPKFYELIENLRNFVVSNKNAIPEPEQILNDWLGHLFKKAEMIFDDVTQSGEFNAVDPGRVAKAWNNLKWKILGDETKGILGLPMHPKVTGSKKKQKRSKK